MKIARPSTRGASRFASLVGGLFLASVAMFGQANANKGQIVGTVYDQKDAVIPNAKVALKSPGTGAQRKLLLMP